MLCIGRTASADNASAEEVFPKGRGGVREVHGVDLSQTRIVVQDGVDDFFILFRIDGAADIHHTPSAGKRCKAGGQEVGLKPGQGQYVLGPTFCLDVRPAAEDSQSGTGDIKKYAVGRLGGERWIAGIGGKHRNGRQVQPDDLLAAGNGFVDMHITGPDVCASKL